MFQKTMAVNFLIIRFFFLKEKTIILIRTHKYESNIKSFLNRLIIHFIIIVPLQNELTFVIVPWIIKIETLKHNQLK